MADTAGPSGAAAADNAALQELSELEREKLTQFKDLTGIEQTKCLQILRANEWNLEVALDLALDGAYADDQTIYSNQLPQQSSSDQQESSHLRHRITTGGTSASTSGAADAGSSSGLLHHLHHPRNPFEEDSSDDDDDDDDHGGRGHERRAAPDTNDQRHRNASESEQEQETAPQSLPMVLWNSATWLFKLPFIIVINTLNAFYDLFATLIRPTLNYDATGTVDRFIAEFEEKYGRTHPPFARTSYTALLEQGKREIRFILLYLHSPAHRDTDRFCTEVLATPRFTDFVTTEHGLLFWGCSVYYPEGYRVWQALRAGAAGNAPFLALVGLKNHRMVAMKKVEAAGQSLAATLTTLRSAIANNEHSLIATRVDREERQMASLIRAQQDAAFEESLRADQEKERLRREAAERQAEAERRQVAAQEAEAARLAALAALKVSLKAAIPPEPEAAEEQEAGLQLFRLMIRLPDGTKLERRFRRDDPVKLLYYYVFTSTPPTSLLNFKICTTFPSRQLPGHSPVPGEDDNNEAMNTSLVDCGLGNNYVLYVYDLDS